VLHAQVSTAKIRRSLLECEAGECWAIYLKAQNSMLFLQRHPHDLRKVFVCAWDVTPSSFAILEGTGDWRDANAVEKGLATTFGKEDFAKRKKDDKEGDKEGNKEGGEDGSDSDEDSDDDDGESSTATPPDDAEDSEEGTGSGDSEEDVKSEDEDGSEEVFFLSLC
jgi:hypothetical protein